jgi:hypothetical protein
MSIILDRTYGFQGRGAAEFTLTETHHTKEEIIEAIEAQTTSIADISRSYDPMRGKINLNWLQGIPKTLGPGKYEAGFMCDPHDWKDEGELHFQRIG